MTGLFMSQSGEAPRNGDLVLSGVSRRYDPSTLALDDADVAISFGQSIAIVGPSGSGKSTLLAILGLLDSPSSGSYLFDGIETVGLDEAQLSTMRATRIGFVFQAFHLIPHLSALENVELSLSLAKVPTAERRDIAVQALGQVGLSRRLDSFPSTMSGGEQQRLALARATARKPQLLLCDEPTGNLDSMNSQKAIETILSSHDERRITVVVTHDERIASAFTHVIEVLDGRVQLRSEETTALV